MLVGDSIHDACTGLGANVIPYMILLDQDLVLRQIIEGYPGEDYLEDRIEELLD